MRTIRRTRRAHRNAKLLSRHDSNRNTAGEFTHEYFVIIPKKIKIRKTRTRHEFLNFYIRSFINIKRLGYTARLSLSFLTVNPIVIGRRDRKQQKTVYGYPKKYKTSGWSGEYLVFLSPTPPPRPFR